MADSPPLPLHNWKKDPRHARRMCPTDPNRSDPPPPPTATTTPAARRLFLASHSPRRRTLLEQAGFPAEILDSGMDDGTLRRGGVSVAQWTVALANLKACAALEHLAPASLLPMESTVILAADTVVEFRGRVIGQPSDHQQARAIIRELREAVHTVVTGVALLDTHPSRSKGIVADVHHPPIRPGILFHDEATVRVGPIPDDAVEAYLDTGQWKGKAGAYNLIERVQAGWQISWQGDAATIMGLPMRRLTPLLNQLLLRRRPQS